MDAYMVALFRCEAYNLQANSQHKSKSFCIK